MKRYGLEVLDIDVKDVLLVGLSLDNGDALTLAVYVAFHLSPQAGCGAVELYNL